MMNAGIWVSLIWATSLLTVGYHHVVAIDVVEDKLMNDLFSNYTAAARPPGRAKDEGGITVALSFILQSIETLIIRTEQLEMQCYIHVEWYDDRLSWKPSEYDDISVLVIPPTTAVWLPKFTLFNNEASDLYTESQFLLTGVRVTHTGLVIWEPGGIITTSCNVDITYYPFDTQHCPIIYVNWLYPAHQVNLTYTPTALDHMLGLYEPNGEWDLLNYTVHRRDNLDPNTDVYYPSVHFKLTLKRKWLYYVMNLIAPSLLLLFLQLFTFYLPPDSNERISFGLTILLSFVVFVIVISENIPTTSDSVPMIEIFLLVCLVTIIVQVILSIWALRIQSMVVSYPPDSILRLCCLKGKLKKKETKGGALEKATQDAYEELTTRFDVGQTAPGGLGDASETQAVTVLREIRTLLLRANKATSRENDLQVNRDAWQQVMQALDTFCFRFFAFFLAMLFIIVLVILPSVTGTT